MVSRETWNRLNELSEKELDKLAYILDVAMNSLDETPLNKDEKVMILSGMSESKVVEGLKKLK